MDLIRLISRLKYMFRIADHPGVEQLFREWKYHNPLQAKQLAFADRAATIASVGYYHGGDELYQLAGIPGCRHECCTSSC